MALGKPSDCFPFNWKFHLDGGSVKGSCVVLVVGVESPANAGNVGDTEGLSRLGQDPEAGHTQHSCLRIHGQRASYGHNGGAAKSRR